jgi:hypothetical protein
LRKAYDILNDTFYNIIHDVVAKVHRDEKVARMRSAVVIARQKAEEEAAKNREEASAKGSGSVKPSGPDAEEQFLKEVRVETDAAVFDNGKAYLKGNPMQTTKEIICPECRLPRLLYPVTGVGARAVPDPDREYCSQQPLIRKPGHDVHGNLFATDKVNSKKKNKHNTPTSSPPADGHAAPEAPGFPTTKCLNCPRYFVVSRVQQHMDRCMGYSGRNATRNRGSGDTGSGSTPTPSTSTSAAPKRPLADDDATPSTTLTKKKKLNAPKKLSKPLVPSSKLKNGLTPDDLAENGDADIKSEANGDD